MAFATKLIIVSPERGRRRSERGAHGADSTLRDGTGRPIDVEVDDLSRHGFRCTSAAGGVPEIGQTVTLGLGALGSRPAVVRWRAGGSVGCEFDVTLTEIELRGIGPGGVAQPRFAAVARPDVLAPTPARFIASLLLLTLAVDLVRALLTR